MPFNLFHVFFIRNNPKLPLKSNRRQKRRYHPRTPDAFPTHAVIICVSAPPSASGYSNKQHITVNFRNFSPAMRRKSEEMCLLQANHPHFSKGNSRKPSFRNRIALKNIHIIGVRSMTFAHICSYLRLSAAQCIWKERKNAF